MAGLEIRLLGGFELRRGPDPLDPIPLRSARSLLAFLIMNRDRPHTRDLLAGTFWPHLTDSRARRRLSQALWHVRARLRELERDGLLVIALSDTVRLRADGSFWLDVEQFEGSVAEAGPRARASPHEKTTLLEHAVRLYRGDLLDGFYDDWAVPDRERLRGLFLGALQTLTDLLVSSGDYESALMYARKLAQHEPLREDAHQRVMRLAILLGRHTEALRQYERCRRVLSDEFRAQPSQATEDLRRAAAVERTAAHQNPLVPSATVQSRGDSELPFTGRDYERSLARECLDTALAGYGRLVLVEGEAGLGKTRLVHELARDATWRGMDVLLGRASEGSRRPYGPFADALAAGLTPLRAQQLAQLLAPIWLRQLSHLIPSLGLTESPNQRTAAHLPPADAQARMAEAIVLACLALADLTPLMLSLDDIQWADEDTIRVLTKLGERLEDHRIVLVAAYRRSEAAERPTVWTSLRALDRQASSRRILLDPFAPGHIEALLRRSLGLTHINPDLTRTVLRETGGVPSLVIEVLRVLQDPQDPHQPLSAIKPAAAHQHLTLTAAVRQLVQARVRGLPDSARAVLNLLSIHPGELTLEELVAATELTDPELVQALDELVGKQLVMKGRDGYSLSHALLGQVLCSDLPKAQRLALHRRVALTIEHHRPSEAEMLAHHFMTAKMPDQAIHYLEQAAARALSVSGYETAAGHLTQALRVIDSVPRSPEREYRVAAQLEEILDTLARRDEQASALERMRRCATGEDVCDVSRRESWWLAHQDRFTEAQTEAHRAVELARSTGDRGRVVAALATLGMIACLAGRAVEGVAYLEQAATYRGADLRQQADARNALGQNLLDLQRFEEAEPQLLAALALYAELHDERGQADVLGALGTLRMERGEPDLAENSIQRAIEVSRQIGYRHGEGVSQMNLGILRALTNRPHSAFLAFRQSAQIHATVGNRRSQALVLSNAAWLRHAVLGDDDGAERDAREALSVYEQMGDLRGEAQSHATIGSIRYRSGEAQEACRHLEQALDSARQARDSWLEAQILTEWARCDLNVGLTPEGLERVGRALLLCSSLGLRDLGVSAKALLGRLLIASGRFEDGLRATTESLQGLRIGVASAHLVPFSHSLALAALGREAEADYYLEMAYGQLLAILGDMPREDREAALARVPDHRAIVSAWCQRQPTKAEFRLARVGATTGRPLEDHERVSVIWTVHCADDLAIVSVADRRRQRLLRLLNEAAAQGAVPTVPDLAAGLDVSVATARRDLALLRKQGHDIVTRGSRRVAPQPHALRRDHKGPT